ncbi:MAG TPA: dihydroneopterin aldolase [Ferrovibrio sp.]|jgi:dihydroneopterin aldolase|uniref:dihydroneopterin aldolase n=1 Tax=Ferrovibrio sp. TaxID=1917215 RepID=UPI002B4B24E9|nr:dihydroneopterin aldolase [Ferrovibrio sp.]HLT76036.1 dihydroneopterin aldolase [Ferrovibrio sp.]
MTIHERARAAWAEIPVPALSPPNPPLRRVFVRGLELQALIGIYPHERERPQTVRISMDLWVPETPGQPPKTYAEVVCYEQLVNRTRELLAQGHVDLVETLAERLAEMCLADPRVQRVRVSVEKPDAIVEAAGVGVEIERRRT